MTDFGGNDILPSFSSNTPNSVSGEPANLLENNVSLNPASGFLAGNVDVPLIFVYPLLLLYLFKFGILFPIPSVCGNVFGDNDVRLPRLNASTEISGTAGSETFPPALGTIAERCAKVTLVSVTPAIAGPCPTGRVSAVPYWSRVEPSGFIACSYVTPPKCLSSLNGTPKTVVLPLPNDNGFQILVSALGFNS